MIIKSLIVGWGILLIAILLNFIAQKIGIWTWYDFLGEVGKNGFYVAFSKSSLFSKIFLFLIYPFSLGGAAIVVLKILNHFKHF